MDFWILSGTEILKKEHKSHRCKT